MKNSKAVTILTTSERAEYFRGVFKGDADYRVDPRETIPLCDFLFNRGVVGRNIIVLDEDHFPCGRDMFLGIQEYVNDASIQLDAVRLIVVCSERYAGDAMLSFLVSCCGIYDVIYGCSGVGISTALKDLLDKKSTRRDVLELLKPVSDYLLYKDEGEDVAHDAIDKVFRLARSSFRVYADDEPGGSVAFNLKFRMVPTWEEKRKGMRSDEKS